MSTVPEQIDKVNDKVNTEPDPPSSAAEEVVVSTSAGSSAVRLLTQYSLVVVLVAVWVFFSIVNSDVFATTATLQTILLTQATIAMIALAVMVPLIAGQFDLSAGFQYGFAQSLCAVLVVQRGWPPLLAVVAVIAAGALIGGINGQLVTRLQLPSFTTTLGTGLLVLGTSEWITGSQIITGSPPQWFLNLGRGRIAGIPLPFVYLFVIAIVLFVLLELTVWGRRSYAIGSNPVAARLTGIAADHQSRQTFVIAGVLCSIAGCLSFMSLGGSSPVVGLGSLLPAFAGAFLGATCIRPGRYNVAGTVIAVYVIGTGIIGLQQLGVDTYVQDLFNGAALLIAIIVASLAVRRKTK